MGKERGRGETVALIRLHIIAEGATEETFVNTVLAPELGQVGVFADTHSVTTGRRHGRSVRGGFLRYEHLARDLTLWMKQDQNPVSWFTTMVDLYALPADFPGREIPSPHLATRDRVVRLEAALAQDITQRLDGLPVASRFIPYLQTHEFEALLFADASGFLEAFPGRQDAVDGLTAIRTRFATPEDIDDGADTAPSKRILGIVPDYEKPVSGPLIAQRIGLAAIRRECPHFACWVSRLIGLVSMAASEAGL